MQNKNQIIDLEEFSQADKLVPVGHKYQIRIDREKYVVDKECMTGIELLLLAGKNPPDKYQLNLKLKGGEVRKIALEQKVCFTEKGIERFMTLPLDQTEG